MFKEMRRKDRMMDHERAVEVLKAGEYGVLSMVTPDGYGYGVPINYAYEGDVIYVHCATSGHKLDSIKANSKVSFCVVGKVDVLADQFTTNYESVIAFGGANVIEGEEKTQALVAILKKYSSDFMEAGLKMMQEQLTRTVVIKVQIEHMTGKRRASK